MVAGAGSDQDQGDIWPRLAVWNVRTHGDWYLPGVVESWEPTVLGEARHGNPPVSDQLWCYMRCCNGGSTFQLMRNSFQT